MEEALFKYRFDDVTVHVTANLGKIQVQQSNVRVRMSIVTTKFFPSDTSTMIPAAMLIVSVPGISQFVLM